MPRPSAATAHFHATILRLEKLVDADDLFARIPPEQVFAALTFPVRRPAWRLRQALLTLHLAPRLAEYLRAREQLALTRLSRLMASPRPGVAYQACMATFHLALPDLKPPPRSHRARWTRKPNSHNLLRHAPHPSARARRTATSVPPRNRTPEPDTRYPSPHTPRNSQTNPRLPPASTPPAPPARIDTA